MKGAGSEYRNARAARKIVTAGGASLIPGAADIL